MRKGYTASERRGVLAVALIALVLTGLGVLFGIFGRQNASAEYDSQVLEYSELVDSAASDSNNASSVKASKWKESKDKSKEGKDSSGNKEKKARNKSKSSKQEKTYRKRSPLDEPV